jgi:hypothetical protein
MCDRWRSPERLWDTTTGQYIARDHLISAGGNCSTTTALPSRRPFAGAVKFYGNRRSRLTHHYTGSDFTGKVTSLALVQRLLRSCSVSAQIQADMVYWWDATLVRVT